ncbi:MAG TPA: hypothetical protein VEV81_06570 [Pyrinomonadaceae bacterium]|nr:hypothetical protein [Pyrinomonadaceae bacterium]
MREEFIAQALGGRFRQLCGERISGLAPESFGEAASFVALAREQLRKASPAALKESLPELSRMDGWMETDADCLSSLRRLCLGEQLALRPGQPRPLDSFLQSLKASAREPERLFQLLTERYSCPLNFILLSEEEAREAVLAQLMARDRARVEKSSLAAAATDDLWLRLNLVAIEAARATDLRFLDALNYYYELLPSGWYPLTRHSWLLVSYFGLYARALAARV